ncbi:hypothetical protein [Sphingomonas sp.]|uniref:hypothetical protein n=1 Tax=Sphingomonas sp. TaxID=28214 RepID=UPI0025EADA78|nr:hypothetical protein [Sphingomonas sp.]
MNKAPALAALAALLSLAACNGKATPTAEQNAADAANAVEAAKPPVEMPPSVVATKTFRCDDNSVVSVEFYVGDKQANLHPTEKGAAVMLRVDEAGKPLIAEGYSLAGDQKKITLAMPAKPSQTCTS